MAEAGQGFLGRWARRKTEVLQGKTVDEPAAQAMPVASLAPVKTVMDVTPAAAAPAQEESEKPLSLDDVKLLTKDSDFTPFMAPNVGPDVRNAAMKKLFTDPHYNVMDGLDIYIGDYSIPDPIPEAMLRRMVGAKLLKIFHDEDEKLADGESLKEDHNNETSARQLPVASLPPDDLNNPMPKTAAESANSQNVHSPKLIGAEYFSRPGPLEVCGVSQQDDHANTHLRLQPDDAPTVPGAGRGAA